MQALSLKDTKFGRETLGEVGQMQAPPVDANATYFVEYHATLHSNQGPNNGLSGYYGRTASSRPLKLQQNATSPDLYESTAEDFFFIHTSFAEPSSTLIVECVISKHAGRGGH